MYVYEQDGKFFNGTRDWVDQDGVKIEGEGQSTVPGDPDKIIQTDGVDTATAFLKNLLGGGAMAKAILYSQAEGMNLDWNDVKKAATAMKIITSQRNKAEWWQLSESGN